MTTDLTTSQRLYGTMEPAERDQEAACGRQHPPVLRLRVKGAEIMGHWGGVIVYH